MNYDNLDVNIINKDDIHLIYKKNYDEIALIEKNIINDNKVGEAYGWHKNWDHYHIFTSQIVHKKVIEFLKYNNYTHFINGIEFACGTTTIFNSINVDNPLLSDIALSHCQFMRNKGYKCIEGNMEDSLFEENYSNITVAFGVLSYVLSYNKAIEQIKTVTCNNGLVLITVPYDQILPWEEFDLSKSRTGLPLRTFNENNIKERFIDRGFNILYKE